MDIEKLDINAVCFGILCNFTPVCGEERAKEAVELVRTLQTENERLRAAVDNWKKKYVEANGKWIEAENKWAGLDKAVRNGTVYRPMQEELNLTHEENQSLKDAIEKLRVELEQVKREEDKLERFLGELEGAVYTGQYFHLRPMIDKWRGQEEG